MMAMIWIVSVVLAIILLAGLARMLLFFRGQTVSVPESERSISRQKVLSISIGSIACSSIGFILLFSKSAQPLEVLVGVVLVVSLLEIAIRRGTSSTKA